MNVVAIRKNSICDKTYSKINILFFMRILRILPRPSAAKIRNTHIPLRTLPFFYEGQVVPYDFAS